MSPTRLLPVALVAAALCACLPDADMKLDDVTLAPADLDDGWEISTPEAEGFDPDALAAVYETFLSEEAFPTARSLLVVRHGKLVAEGYARDPDDIRTPHDIQSATKSITSILAGIALDQGLFDSVDDRVYDVIPSAFDGDADKRDITLRHALSMTTGLAFDNQQDTLPFYNSTGSSLEYLLHRPLLEEPGSTWRYQDGTPQLVSGMIQERSGQPAARFAEEHLFAPLGIEDYRWEAHDDGLAFGAFGLWLLPRDMARIGQLMLQDGEWEGRRVVSADWVAASTAPSVTFEYGWYWWWWEDLAGFEASGHGGQTIFVKPDADLVVVITSDSYAEPGDLGAWFPGLYWPIVDAMVDPTPGSSGSE